MADHLRNVDGVVAALANPVALDDLVVSLSEAGQLVHLERLPARAARTAEPARPLPPAVAARLPMGAAGLWSHQAAAIDRARDGRSVVVATGTASGKSLCYQVPIASAAAEGRATALLLFPTKALAHDQLRALDNLGFPSVVPAAYDGDASAEDRAWARRHASVVCTNPDMLHAGILPNHRRWATFLMRLRYVVVDELHTLRGVFGSHVAHVLRRLRRLCASYGSSPTFVFCSATIGRPAELASTLCGLPVEEVADDGSPRGERLFALWQPPPVDEPSGRRVPSGTETARLLAGLVTGGRRVLAFSRSRRSSELVAASARRQVGPELAATVRPYRGGYLAKERREIEAELSAGRLRGVAATNALELGIDVGGLEACILNGFPGTIASMWQQAGRAGRAQQQSLAVLVAGEDALDQWLMTHPAEVFARPPEPAVINPSNPFVLDAHLACAAYERPLVREDASWWEGIGKGFGDELREGLEPGAFDDAVRRLVLDDRLVLRRAESTQAMYAGGSAPARTVGLRSGSPREYRITTASGQLVGTVDEASAFTSVHPGAVYLHQGRHWQVDHLDLADRTARVEPASGEEYTQARSETSIVLLGEERSVRAGRLTMSLGPVEVTHEVVGYRRKRIFTGEVLGDEPLTLPPTSLTTRAFWYTVPPAVLVEAGVPGADVPGTLHAAEHAGIGMLPLFTICDRWDVGGVSTAWQAQTGAPTIVIYDGWPGGAGIAELGFAAAHRHLEATLEAIATCPCAAGCPSCVQSPKCGNLNEPLDKAGAVALLRTALG